jgi:hypothetical protein
VYSYSCVNRRVPVTSHFLSTPGSGKRHLQPSCAVAVDGSLSPNSFRARRMLVTDDLGQFLPYTHFRVNASPYKIVG